MYQKLISKWHLALKTLIFVVLIVGVKFVVHYFEYEFLTLNSLFTAVISANIFLIGFLLSGTLVDYKESEKLPIDLASSLESMADEGMILYTHKKTPESKKYLTKILHFNQSILEWLHKRERTQSILLKIHSFNDEFLAFESQTQANFIVRLKQEQNALRKIVQRIDAIRDVSFLSAGYAITEIISAVLILGLIFIKINPYYESIFFVSFVSFILIYMILFIKDLDNPFDYSHKNFGQAEVSLKPIVDVQNRLKKYMKSLKISV